MERYDAIDRKIETSLNLMNRESGLQLNNAYEPIIGAIKSDKVEGISRNLWDGEREQQVGTKQVSGDVVTDLV